MSFQEQDTIDHSSKDKEESGMDLKSSEIVPDKHTTNENILFDNLMSSHSETMNICNVNDIMQVNCNLGEINTEDMDKEKYNHFNNNFENDNVICNKKNKITTPQNTIDIAEFDSLINNQGLILNENIKSTETDTPHLDTEKLLSQINSLSKNKTENTPIINENSDSLLNFDKVEDVSTKENKDNTIHEKANVNTIVDDILNDNMHTESKHGTRLLLQENYSSTKDQISHVVDSSVLLSSEGECLDNVGKPSTLENTMDDSCINDLLTNTLDTTDFIQDNGNVDKNELIVGLPPNDNIKNYEKTIDIDNKDMDVGKATDLNKSGIINEATNLSEDRTNFNEHIIQNDKTEIQSELETKIFSNEINEEANTLKIEANNHCSNSNELLSCSLIDNLNSDLENTLNKLCNNDNSDSSQGKENANNSKLCDVSYSIDKHEVDNATILVDKMEDIGSNTLDLGMPCFNENETNSLDITDYLQNEDNSNSIQSKSLIITENDIINKEINLTNGIINNDSKGSNEIKCTGEVVKVNASNISKDASFEIIENSSNINNITANQVTNDKSGQAEENSNGIKISNILVSDDANKDNGTNCKIEDIKIEGGIKSESSVQQQVVEQCSPALDLKFAEQIISVGEVPENIVIDTEKLVEKTTSSGTDKSEQNTESTVLNLKSQEPGENHSTIESDQIMNVSEKVNDTNLINISNENCDSNLDESNLSKSINDVHFDKEISSNNLTTSNTGNMEPVDKIDIYCSDDEGVGSEYSNTESSVTGNDGVISSCNEELTDVTETVTEYKEDLSTKNPCYDRQISDEDLCSSKEGKLRRLDTMDYISDDEDSKTNDSEEEKEVIVQKKKCKRSKKRKVYRAMDSSLSKLDTVDENSRICLFEKNDQAVKHIKNQMNNTEQESITGESTCSDIDNNENHSIPAEMKNNSKEEAPMNSNIYLDFTQPAYTTNTPNIAKSTFVPEVHTQKESRNDLVGLNMFEKRVESPANTYVNELFDGDKSNESSTIEKENVVMEDICLKASKINNFKDDDKKVEENDNPKQQRTIIEESKDKNETKELELPSESSELHSVTSDDMQLAEPEENTDKDNPEETTLVSYGITSFMYNVFSGMFSGMKRLNCPQPGAIRPPSPPPTTITESDVEEDTHAQDIASKEESPLTVTSTDSDHSRPRRPSFISEELFASKEPFLCYENSIKIV